MTLSLGHTPKQILYQQQLLTMDFFICLVLNPVSSSSCLIQRGSWRRERKQIWNHGSNFHRSVERLLPPSVLEYCTRSDLFVVISSLFLNAGSETPDWNEPNNIRQLVKILPAIPETSVVWNSYLKKYLILNIPFLSGASQPCDS